ncbi:LEA1 [Candida oxycetoniae]|uniref:U2 small nuclear ribonucleoprotein A' n=1 Tax=Candida oxycetoniae TaxID=497107 RepID=A0AAI9T0J7_9ASCO|nr:LEA1 [Candida oxycetoniae]KAI3406628.2 LEA1 [Candida oxycetoniae]
MRLTVQQVQEAPLILNPEHKVTLVLRDLRLTDVTNIAGMRLDKYQVLDLSNNELIVLGKLSDRFEELEVLLLANNNITYVDDEFCVANKFGCLRSISFMNNNIYKFQQNFVAAFDKVENLVLIGNPITKHFDYRLFMIWLVPSLRVLDFKKVKLAERSAASKLFGTLEEPFNEKAKRMFDLELDIEAKGKHIAPPSDKQMSAVVKKLSKSDKEALMKRLKSATSIEEVESIEQLIKTGDI